MPPNTLLISHDVTSMYTNMYENELISAVDRVLEKIDAEDYFIPVPPKKRSDENA